MDVKSLQTKSKAELEGALRETQDAIREVRFRVHRGEEKGVRKIRELRTSVAQLLTMIKKIG